MYYQVLTVIIIGLFRLLPASRENLDARLYAKKMASRLWKLAIAFVISGLLTWREWVEHHPPEIALVAVLHFLVVWIALLLIVQLARWLGRKRRHKDS